MPQQPKPEETNEYDDTQSVGASPPAKPAGEPDASATSPPAAKKSAPKKDETAERIASMLERMEALETKRSEAEEKAEEVEEEYTPGLDETAEKELAAEFRKLAARSDKQIKALKQQVKELRTEHAKVKEVGRAAELTESLDDESLRGLLQNSHKRQREVIEQMEVVKAGYKAVGRKAPVDETLFRRAALALFGDEAGEARMADDPKKDRSIERASPTPNGTKRQGKEAAVNALRNLMRDRGMSVSGVSLEEDDDPGY